MVPEVIGKRPNDNIQPLTAVIVTLELSFGDDLSSAVQAETDGLTDYESGALYGIYVARHLADWALPPEIAGDVHWFRSSIDKMRGETTGLSTVPESYEA